MVTMTTDFAAENQYINARDTYEQRGGGKLPFPDQVALEWLREFYPRGPWTIELVRKAHQYYIGKIEGPEDLARMWLDTPTRPGEIVALDETLIDYDSWPFRRIPEQNRVYPPPPGTWADAPYSTIDWAELSLDILNVIKNDRENMYFRVYGDGYVFQKPIISQSSSSSSGDGGS